MAGRDQLVGRTRAYRLVGADMALARDCMQQDRLGASPNRCTALASMTGFYSGYVYEVIPASLVLKLRRKPEEWCDEYESGLLRVPGRRIAGYRAAPSAEVWPHGQLAAAPPRRLRGRAIPSRFRLGGRAARPGAVLPVFSRHVMGGVRSGKTCCVFAGERFDCRLSQQSE